MNLILKSFLTAALLLVLHSLYVRKMNYVGCPPQQQWQDNAIKAQNYLFDNSRSPKYVIVGSSLSCKLIKDSLQNFYNLSLAGKSIYDGFAIMKKNNYSPEYLFIEMNFFLRQGSPSFISSVTDDIPYFLKKHFPSLRDQYEPTSVIGSKLVNPFIDWTISTFKSKSKNKNSATGEEQSESVFNKMMDIQLKLYNDNPADSILSNRMKDMKTWITYFESRNIKIVFYEMPIDAHLKDLIRAKRVRESFYQNFPPGEYAYLPDSTFTNLKTKDGLHLNTKSAQIFTGYFNQEARKIISTSIH